MGTVPIMPVMSSGGNNAGKRADYGQFLDPMRKSTVQHSDHRTNGKSGRRGLPSYEEAVGKQIGSTSGQQRTPIMPGILNSPKKGNGGIPVIHREVEW